MSGVWQEIARKRLAVSVWLPRTATREQIAEAIEQLSDANRREVLRRQLAGIPEAQP